MAKNSFFTSYIKALEENKTPFACYILTFLAFVLIRCLTEVNFTVETQYQGLKYFRVFSTQYKMILHFILFYISLFLTLIMVMHIFTQKSLKSVSCFALGSSWVILLPLGEFIFFNGFTPVEFHITYLTPELHRNLLQRFFTFGGSMVKEGNTLAGISLFMKAEVIVVLFVSFFYGRKSSLSKKRSLLMASLIYCVIFCYALPPFFCLGISKLSGIRFQPDNTTLTQLYLLLIFIQLFPLAYMGNKTLFKVLLKDTRPFRLLFFLTFFYTGSIVAYNLLPLYRRPDTGLSETLLKTTLISVALFFAAQFSIVTNNMADLAIDKISNKERPLIKHSELFSCRIIIILLSLSLLLSSLFSLAAGYDAFCFISTVILLYSLYSLPPLRLKRVPFLSKFLIALNLWLLFILGFAQFNKNLHDIPMVYSFLILGGGTFLLNFIDIKDYSGDKTNRILTLPVILGYKKCKRIIGLFFLLCSGSLFFCFRAAPLSEFFILLGFIPFFLINKKRYRDPHIILCSLALWSFFIYISLTSGQL